ncbi:MAG: hypothetical protein QG597_2121, partial [Actinomycetota bacterium]|nr:hypothetical protein [Actinomycetota bacterium]
MVSGIGDGGEPARLQSEVARLDARLRATVDSLADPYLVLRPHADDADGRADVVVVDANPAACHWLAVERDELMG